MTISNVRKLLVDLALTEKSESKIAKVLAYYYPNISFTDKKTFFEDLSSYYKSSADFTFDFSEINKEIESDNEINSYSGKDFRIKYIEVSDLRGIPEKDENGIPFGISLLDDGVINNSIILATNGTGKSSVFAGLEMIYSQKIGEKRLRSLNQMNLTKEDYSNYLKRFPLKNKPHFKIVTNEGTYDLEDIIFKNDKIRNTLNPSNHFVSDFDIYYYGQKEYNGDAENPDSFHSLIANSLGLGDFIRIQSILKETISYRRNTESTTLKRLNSQEAEANRSIKNFTAEIQSKNIALSELKEKSNQNSVTSVKSDRAKKLSDLANKPFYYSIEGADYLTTLENFNRAYSKSLSLEINQRQSIEKDFLSAGLDLIHAYDNCPFCENSNKTLKEIQKAVEERLQNLQETQKLEEELRVNYTGLINLLGSFYEATTNFYFQLNKERDEVYSLNEFKELAEIEGELYVFLSPLINDEGLKEHILQMSRKRYPVHEDYKRLSDLINQPFLAVNLDVIERINKLIEFRKQLIEKVVSETSQGDQGVEKQIAVLEEEIKRLYQQIETSEKLIESLKPEIEKAVKDVSLVSTIKNEISLFTDIFDTEVNKMVNEAYTPIQDTVEAIFKDYFSNEPFELKIEKKIISKTVDGEEISSSVIQAYIVHFNKETGANETITPDLFFNTFRYKLFCLMVSLSLALATRKKYNVNLPLVMDDLFFASDYVSKNSFSEFLQKLLGLFYKYTPDLPLQFILFTHDDVIFRSSIDAIQSYNDRDDSEITLTQENKIHLIKDTLIGRFFNPKDRDSVTSKFENQSEYWNLLYSIPKSINQPLTDE